MARTKDRLTVAEIQSAKHSGKDQKLSDGGGLYLHIQRSGKYWRWKYRFNGKEKLLAIGVFPKVSLADARLDRDGARCQLEQGIDPSAHRRATRASQAKAAENTLEAVGREWWDSVHQHRVITSHAQRNLRRLERHLFPGLGRRPIADVSPAELLEALRRIERVGHVETAHRVRALCGQVFRYAIATGRASRDIAADLRDALQSPNTKHHAAIIKPEEIGPLLRAMGGYGGEPITRGALWLSALLFVRPGELRKAEWADFDLDAAEWHFTPSKGGQPFTIPLPQQAVAALEEMQSLSRGGRYVFPSARGKGRPMSDATVNAALHRMGYKDVMTAHGFRATARTVLVEHLGYPAEYVEQQLGHTVRDATGRAYNRTTHLEQRREMLQAWADYLDRLREA